MAHINPIIVALVACLFGLTSRWVYYQFKPLIPRRLRLRLRRCLAQLQRARSAHVWPIFEPAGKPPEGWPDWPLEKQFAVVLTHDVEGQKGLDQVRALAELEMSLGFRSSFNFIPEGSYEVPKELRQWLTNNGFEVGVHDHRHDGKLYRSYKGFKASAARINHFLRSWNAVGFRSGFMLRNLSWIHELEVLYDSSTFDTDPFEPQPDGAHTIFPFWVNGPAGRGYVELPYTLAQDSTLFLVLAERTPKIWKQKLDWLAARKGMALLNVHPDYMAFGRAANWDEYPAELYKEFLLWLQATHGRAYWHALPREVAGFCRQAKGWQGQGPSAFADVPEHSSALTQETVNKADL